MSVKDLFNLDGRVAVVTGGAGLLGSAFCRTLAEAGAQVVIADINAPDAAALAESLALAGGSPLAVKTDVSDPDSVRALMASAVESFGRLDVLVNSAALDPKFDPEHEGEHTQAFEEYPLNDWNRALAVDLTGAFLCAQAAARPMRASGGGSIINLCSIYGMTGPDQRLYQRPGEPPQFKPVTYSVTKAGLLGLTRYLATYFGGRGIRVNALTPGGVYHDHDQEFVRAYSARTVLGRMARVDELQGALLFLASDASAYMTGANLVVDGGWTAW
jgi:2-deoxy-D-gluconate 3-dehydrogenase